METTSDRLSLYYGYDPMCSFCWAFRPGWEKVKSELALRAPEIEIISLLGGLAPDSNEPMPAAVREKVSQAWRYIEKRIPGTRFNFDFWTLQQPRRSTYPACRAVFAARTLSADLEDDMVLSIQRAYYLNAKNPSDNNTLIECAVSIGLDEKQFTDTFTSTACEKGFAQEMQFAHHLGITSFPNLVIARGDSRFNIPIDYNHPQTIVDSLIETANLL